MEYLYEGDCFYSKHPEEGKYFLFKVQKVMKNKLSVSCCGVTSYTTYIQKDNNLSLGYEKRIGISTGFVEVDKKNAVERSVKISSDLYNVIESRVQEIRGVLDKIKDDDCFNDSVDIAILELVKTIDNDSNKQVKDNRTIPLSEKISNFFFCIKSWWFADLRSLLIKNSTNMLYYCKKNAIFK